MITPEAPDRSYSTRLRTALLLTGSGTAGAYHAGVLRALHEAGVKIDLVGGRGVGVASALFAAIDGGARLWEPSGIWKDRGARHFYGWRPPLRFAGYALLAAGLVLLLPLALLAAAVVAGLAGALNLLGQLCLELLLELRDLFLELPQNTGLHRPAWYHSEGLRWRRAHDHCR